MRKDAFCFLVFAVLFSLVSLPVVIPHPIINFDDFALVEPMEKIETISDYVSSVEKNKIMDIAPVRDLSYWMEQQIARQTGYLNYQLTNVVLWIVTIGIFGLILRSLELPVAVIGWAIVIVGLHPVMHSSVFWIAGRKHLLAALFVLCATLFLIRSASSRLAMNLLASSVFYVLSAFSQPIGFGFPIFAAAWIYSRSLGSRTAYSIYLLICSAAAVSIGYLNWRYYSSESYANTGATKFTIENLALIGKRFQVWGRDTFQLLIPLKPSVHSYNLNSFASWIGLLLMAGFIFALLKHRRKLSEIWVWILFGILPIGVVTLKLTTQGGMDNYLLIPLFGFAIALLVAFSKRSQAIPRAAVISAIVVFAGIDLYMARAWADPLLLWKTAYEFEGSKEARAQYTRILLDSKTSNREQIFHLAEEIAEEDPQNSNLGYVLGRSILEQNWTYPQKEFYFNKYRTDDVWFDYFWSANDAGAGKFSEASERLSARWNRDPAQFVLQASFGLDDIAVKWTKMCKLANRNDCTSIQKGIEAERHRLESAKR